ncbi:MAG: hypothetical protein ACR2OW_15305 [Methyloligellaceae bacterium]
MATYALGDDIGAAKISSQNVDQMAELLCRRHGRSAFAIANYFALEHEKFGDQLRSEGWKEVAARISGRKPGQTLQ